MKKLFSTAFAISLAFASFNSFADAAAPDAAPDAKPEASAVSTPVPEAAPAVKAANGVIVPELIAEHIAVRFPGKEIKGIAREGVTYVVDLGDNLHIRYDNCFNPVCYGDHSHD